MLARSAATAVLLLLASASHAAPEGVPVPALEADDPCSADEDGAQCDISLRQLRGEATVGGSDQEEHEESSEELHSKKSFKKSHHKQCHKYDRMKFSDVKAAKTQCGGKSKSWCTGVMGPSDGKYYMCQDPLEVYDAPQVGGTSTSAVWTLVK
uniref:Uncharacterized protein n=1 Tax=Alexandrium catenella TaxID=2925 RepID=A0A7S1QSM7_ALECA|mmetsp:Transcript_37734/g.102123  ORF Transcript_37734/g.102123 Transcript_37734/m.102123 type:complete len:153 (+) Transcript_37734:93-551(+)